MGRTVKTKTGVYEGERMTMPIPMWAKMIGVSASKLYNINLKHADFQVSLDEALGNKTKLSDVNRAMSQFLYGRL